MVDNDPAGASVRTISGLVYANEGISVGLAYNDNPVDDDGCTAIGATYNDTSASDDEGTDLGTSHNYNTNGSGVGTTLGVDHEKFRAGEITTLGKFCNSDPIGTSFSCIDTIYTFLSSAYYMDDLII